MENAPNNVDVISDYSEQHVKRLQDSVHSINTRLSWMIGFSGLLLRFAADLHYPATRITMSILSLAAVACCMGALLPKASGKLASPATLLQEYFGDTEQNCKNYIAKGFAQTAEGLNTLRAWRVRWLQVATALMLLALLSFGLDVLIDSLA
jgi:hypothetical protein